MLLSGLIVVVSLLFLSGCTTVQKGAAVGGVAGAAAGGVWGHNQGILSAAEGACVGGAGGGLIGALVGDQLEERKTDNLESEIENLNRQISTLEEQLEKAKEARDRGGEKDQIIEGLKELNDEQSDKIANIKKQLEEKEAQLARLQGMNQKRERNLDELRDQLDKLQVELAKTPKGITLTMVESLLFNPGMAEITDDGKELLNSVADILQNRFPNRRLIIEGHTDNQPIRVSGWKSNWELASARALNVLHHLVNEQSFNPRRLSAKSFGEYHPVASNATEEGRARNRRAVIVVEPTVEITKESL